MTQVAPHDSQGQPGPRSMSIKRGTDAIVALLTEEYSSMQASFEEALMMMEQQLVQERSEREFLMRRVQELEAELKALRYSQSRNS